MKQEKQTREKELETILVLCIFFVVLNVLGHAHHKFFLTISILLGLIGMFSKFLTTKIVWAWLKFSELLGKVMSKVILSIVFFVFLFPISLLSKLFGNKDNLHLKKIEGPSHYFVRNHKFEPKDLENSW